MSSESTPAAQSALMPAPARLMSIDILRAFAAMAVVIVHLPFSMNAGFEHNDTPAAMAFSPAVMRVTNLGQYGVQMFLVLSGFCIHLAWARRADAPLRLGHEFLPFWKRRLRRLYPPYFVTLLLCAVALVVHTKLSHAPITGFASYFGYMSAGLLALDALTLLLLVNNFGNASARFGNPPFWSLALEEQLYALYFPLVWVRRRWGWRATWAMVLGVCLTWDVWMQFAAPRGVHWAALGPALWIEWTLGAWAVEAYLGRAKVPEFFYSPLVGVGALALGIGCAPASGDATASLAVGQLASVSFGVASFVCVNALCRKETRGMLGQGALVRGLARAGTMSYSLYLVHNPAMVVAKKLAMRVGIHSVAGLTVVRISAALLAGYVFFALVERHFLRPRGARTAKDAAGAMQPASLS